MATVTQFPPRRIVRVTRPPRQVYDEEPTPRGFDRQQVLKIARQWQQAGFDAGVATMWPFIWAGLIVGFIMGIVVASAADLPVQAAMAAVERIIGPQFPDLKGYGETAPPPVVIAELRGRIAEFDGTTVTLDASRPEACLQIDLAHELTHHALGKMHGLTPWQSEPFAREVDAALKDDLFLPRC